MDVTDNSPPSRGPGNPGPPRLDERECASLGLLLRAARERRGMSLEQIARETKIPQRHLDSLERGRLEAIPGGAYRRGEVIAYADVVGLDRALVLSQLERALHAGAAEHTSAVPAGLTAPARIARAVGIVAAAIAVALALAVLWQPERTQTALAVVEPAKPPAHVTAPPAHVDPPPAAVPSSAPASAPTNDVRPVVAPPPATDDPAPARGDALVIVTEPPGARVTIDGIGWGTTPVTVPYLPPGPKRVRVTSRGYAAEERTVHVDEQRPIRIVIPLRAQP